MTGDIFKPRVVRLKSDTEQLWTRMWHRAKRADMTFRQARGLFFVENHYEPPPTIALMPTKELDWFRRVSEVPRADLR